ncbi:basic 7S globulin 2 [Arachis duranensis]|uniref:Basic 7S globulin 2 n=1 Tax=Arachis duranensis TaxID=130453 RepID=A0A6P4DHT2_ARADU|nr:basic 7S globulin 2 [Arachis duranensis]
MSKMASKLLLIITYLSFSILFCVSVSTTSHHSHPPTTTNYKPNLLVLPVHKDPTTGLPWAHVHKRTPMTLVPLLLDLNGNHMWINCQTHYASRTYQAPSCHSTQCSTATTTLMSTNPITKQIVVSELAQDVLAINAAANNGPRLGPTVSDPQFLFSCAPASLVQKGLPNNVEGVVGLGHGPISLPNQLASHFGLQRQFTLCLSRNPTSTGAVLFGDPQKLFGYTNKKFDLSRDLLYTPLTVSPQGEYYMEISSIRINGRSVFPVTPSSSPSGMLGATLISTTAPYMVLHHTIFETFRQVFVKQFPMQGQVNAVAPFGLCYDSKRINNAKPPSVDMVVKVEKSRREVSWSISGDNLMVQARPGVTCLGVVNGGTSPRAAIAIGTRQLEEKVVVFDLVKSRVGLSSSLCSRGRSCSDLFGFANKS